MKRLLRLARTLDEVLWGEHLDDEEFAGAAINAALIAIAFLGVLAFGCAVAMRCLG